MPPTPSLLYRALRTYQIYGANTDVGKTVVSTVLCRSLARDPSKGRVWFIKPVSTGDLSEADDRHMNKFAKGVSTKCLWQFDEPVSPHIAANGGKAPEDSKILAAIRQHLSECDSAAPGVAFLETAGGVHSPGPNGTSQADLYRPLRLPVVLVADSRLGGISSSISAYESLVLRGYDVDAVVVFQNDYYRNHEYLGDYFGKKDIPLLLLPPPPPRPMDGVSAAEDEQAMAAYYEEASQVPAIRNVLHSLGKKHSARIANLESMGERAYSKIWYPFTQHEGMSAKDLTVIDSAYGDFFQTLKPNGNGAGEKSLQSSSDNAELTQATFDASASWWTQGLGHGNPELSLTAAYAAGRYGHVMFASAVHEPALSLAELLLKSLGNPRLQRVFYTDNGSTGMEVAVKMGLRASCARYGWDATQEEIGILGLKGSYHGDTMGVMDCSEPSTFNQKVEWYRGRGYWFDFPTVKMVKGSWIVEVPEELQEELGSGTQFSHLSDIFDLEKRRNSPDADLYEKYIKKTVQDLAQVHGRKFGALIIEPVVLGAGGMFLCDPMFQQTLVRVVRENPSLFSVSTQPAPSSASSTTWSGLPVVFDEVFTGLYRLGRRTSASFLQTHPDISVNAKLLTGGLIPLCVTLSSESIFNAFLTPEKSDALLHGHSYTAHAVGCSVAQRSVQTLMEMDQRGEWDEFKKDWAVTTSSSSPSLQASTTTETNVWSTFSHTFLTTLSSHDGISSVWALGSVIAIALRDTAGTAGYSSDAAKGLQAALLKAQNCDWNVHSRVLGNVLYLMTGQRSKLEDVRSLEALVLESLDA